MQPEKEKAPRQESLADDEWTSELRRQCEAEKFKMVLLMSIGFSLTPVAILVSALFELAG